MPRTNENTSIVTLIDRRHDESTTPTRTTPWSNASVVTLPHPSTGVDQHFLQIPSSDAAVDIYEMQSVSKKYGSFLVKSRVVSNGALHVTTRVDPLFFVLACLGNTTTTPQWQPLDQLEDIPSVVQEALTSNSSNASSQWKHVCGVQNLGDDLVLYKFQPEKALEWLVKKQEATYKVLCAQMMQSKLKSNHVNEVEKRLAGGGAFSSGFQLADDDEKIDKVETKETTTTTSDCQLTSSEEALAKDESVQIVCEYLSLEWRTKLRKHLNITEEIMQEDSGSSTTHNNKRRATWEANPGQDDADQLLQFTMGAGGSGGDKDDSCKKKEPAQTAGLKRLAKVSTKGMKNLSSFFGVKKKNKGE